MENLQFDPQLLIQFEKTLDPSKPEKSKIPVQILGYGEISTVLEIGDSHEAKELAFKRMPLFQNEQEIKEYVALYHEYNERLLQLGVKVPVYDTYYMQSAATNNYVFYGIQRKVNYSSIGNRVIHLVTQEEVGLLLRKIILTLGALFAENNRTKGQFELAIDGQISNWAVLDFDGEHPAIHADSELIYIDTSTPLIKKNGGEQLNPELFLRSAPSFLVWVIRKFFLKDVLERYYDFRLVMIDLIANFYKEQREDLVPYSIALINQMIQDELREFELPLITEKEVKKYYQEDAFIWKFYLAARKTDRFLHRLIGKPYPYILPKITKR